MRKGDTTIAFKAIALSELTSAHKRVAAAVLDHYNRTTGRCDPSMKTLSILLAMSRRTVVRAVNSLAKQGYFERDRHGGNFHCNRYIPIWTKYRSIEANWRERRRAHRGRFDRMKVSPPPCPQGHVAGDHGVTQTCPDNQFYETCMPVREGVQNLAETTGPGKTMERLRQQQRQQASRDRKASTGDIARDAAERRWVDELSRRYSADAAVYASVVAFIDRELQNRATEAELKQPGAGIELVEETLRQAGVVRAAARAPS
jgi:hypothetical protein